MDNMQNSGVHSKGFYGILFKTYENAIDLLTMHKTHAGEKRRALQKDALELARDTKAAMKAAKTLPEALLKANELRRSHCKVQGIEAPSEALEDLHVWQMEKVKTTKKGSRSYRYWIATWREGGKTRNVHLGSCGKLDEETARQKARELKAAALAIKL
jgi:hypothetical protein